MSMTCRGSLLGAVLLGILSGGALAAPGDIHRVSGADVVNLRAGPSDASNIRGRIDHGDEVIELTRDGNWVGVRVLQTGEEGWSVSRRAGCSQATARRAAAATPVSCSCRKGSTG